jgi:hypothetical protein
MWRFTESLNYIITLHTAQYERVKCSRPTLQPAHYLRNIAGYNTINSEVKKSDTCNYLHVIWAYGYKLLSSVNTA